MSAINAGSQRRCELDWLRVTAILLIFIFHSGRFFDPMDWHVKNPVTYAELEILSVFIASWMMPLVFVISGASVFYAAGKSGSGKFLKSKVSRLLIPLVVAIFTHSGLLERIKQLRWLSLAGGVICVVFLFRQMSGGNIPLWGTERYRLLSIFYCLNSWCWILTFLGFAQKHLAFNSPALKYANEAVLPFYIMHQTVLLCVGYFVVRWSLPDVLAYLVIAAVSLITIMGLYEFFVRRFNLLRLLFGMKLLPRLVSKPERQLAAQ